jgi:hypothetical protein
MATDPTAKAAALVEETFRQLEDAITQMIAFAGPALADPRFPMHLRRRLRDTFRHSGQRLIDVAGPEKP